MGTPLQPDFALDTHKRILKKFAEILAGEIKTNVTVWELRFNSVEAKLEVHREKWKAVVPNPSDAIHSTHKLP